MSDQGNKDNVAYLTQRVEELETKCMEERTAILKVTVERDMLEQKIHRINEARSELADSITKAVSLVDTERFSRSLDALAEAIRYHADTLHRERQPQPSSVLPVKRIGEDGSSST